MVTELSNPFTMHSPPTIELQFDVQSIHAVWGSIAITPRKMLTLFNQTAYAASKISLYEKPKQWLRLSGPDGTAFMLRKDAAGLLKMDARAFEEHLSSIGGLKKIANLLQVRLLFPDWTSTEQHFPREWQALRKDLIAKAQHSYQSFLTRFIHTELDEADKHYTREESQTPLPIIRTAAGRSYAILKNSPHSPPWKEGAFKRIFPAIDLQTLEITAWAKLSIRPETKKSKEQVRLEIENEIAMLKKFQSPQFVKILHHFTYVGKSGNEKKSIMYEYCGYDLASQLPCLSSSQSHPLAQQSLWSILEDSCLALAHLEEKEIRHHDVKASNILLQLESNRFRAKLADFGFAKTIAEEKAHPCYCGSPEFLAPEFVQAHKQLEGFVQYARALQSSIHSVSQKKIQVQRELQFLIGLAERHKSPSRALLKEIEEAEISNASVDKEFQGLKDELHKCCQQSHEAVLKAANAQVDIWALGHVLYEMRTNKSLLEQIMGKNSNLVSTPQCLTFLAKLTDQDVALGFSSRIQPGSLEELNRLMLMTDPKKRITAKACLAKIRQMRGSGQPFS